jgi:quercetin dioxygenase-like cupin family protein
MGAEGAIVLGVGDGESFQIGPNRVTLKAGGEDTGGAYALLEYTLAPEFGGTPPHRHAASESFLVVDGEIDVWIADRWIRGRPGALFLVPGRLPHTMRNGGPDPARVFIVGPPTAPAYLRDLASVFSADGVADPDRLNEVFARHGIERAGDTD